MNTKTSYYRTSLCITSQFLSAKEITELLGFEPTRCYEKGSRMSPRNPRSRIRQESSWFIDYKSSREESFESQIEELMFFIENHLEQFRKLLETCHIEIYCSFFAEEDNGAFFLNSNLLKKLTLIPLDITVALYSPINDSEDNN